jgi:alkylation response protein AidB-like acyl-CoA dehydrogenase
MEFSVYLQRLKDKLHNLFNEQEDINLLSLDRGISEELFNEIMECQPLNVFIPQEYGGRGITTYEALSVLEVSSYESLPLSLMMGINGALFLQPLANYGQESVKSQIFSKFVNEKNMGGLMITEPDFGSDALHMETCYHRDAKTGNYHVKGVKHWAGLTGSADYWLITARKRDKNGNLGRDISFFIHDTARGGIKVEEYYKNLGLYMLPYGRNIIDIEVPADYKLQPKSIGIKMMLDVLHRSRLQFPGMGIGFLKRMLDEAVNHCKQRIVGGQSLIDYDQVKERISRLQSYFTVCSAMCTFTSENVPIDKDVSGMDLPANTIKTVTTDMMQSAAQSLLQLMGANGYRLDHIAGRSLIDSRPFQIFEGSNDILYQQISESVIKKMRKLKTSNLYEFLSSYSLTGNATDYVKELLNFKIDSQLAQHRLVELGRIISRLISLEFTIHLGDKGFNGDLVENTINTLKGDIERMMTKFQKPGESTVVSYYEEASSWLDTVTRKQLVHS